MNIESDKDFIKISSFVKKSFNDTCATYCKLLICCTGDRIKLVIYNTGTDKIEAFIEYKIKDIINVSLSKVFEEIMNNKLLDFFRGKKIILCVDSENFTILPKEAIDFKSCSIQNYLELNNKISERETPHYAINSPGEISVIFSIDKSLFEWFNKINEFKQVNIIHYGNALISGIKNYTQSKMVGAEPTVSLFFTKRALHIIILHKENLQYYNRINLDSPESSLAFLLTVMKQLKVDRMFHKVFVFGDSDHHTGYVKLYSKYIKKIEIPFKNGWIFNVFRKKNKLEYLHFDAIGCMHFLK